MADEVDCTVDLQDSTSVDEHTSDITSKDETNNPCEESCVKSFLENDPNDSEKRQNDVPFKFEETVKNNSESLSEMKIPLLVSSVNVTNKTIDECKEKDLGEIIPSCEKSLNEGLARKDKTNNPCEESCVKSILENDSEKRQNDVPFKFEETVKNNSESLSEVNMSPLASVNGTNKNIDEFKEKTFGKNISSCEKSPNDESPTKCDDLARKDETNNPCEESSVKSFLENDPNGPEKRQDDIPFKFKESVKNSPESLSEMKVSVLASSFNDTNKSTDEFKEKALGENIPNCEKILNEVLIECEESVNGNSEFPSETQTLPSFIGFIDCNKSSEERCFYDKTIENEAVQERFESVGLNIGKKQRRRKKRKLMDAELQKQPSNESIPEEKIMEAELQIQPSSSESIPKEKGAVQQWCKKRLKLTEKELQKQPSSKESIPKEKIMEEELQNQPSNNESMPNEKNAKQLRQVRRRKRQKLMKEKKKQQARNENISKGENSNLETNVSTRDSVHCGYQAGKKPAVSRPTMLWKRRRRQFIREGSSTSSIAGGIILNDSILKGYCCTYCACSLQTMQEVDEHISGLQHLKSLLRIQYEERKLELENRKKDEETKKSDAVVESIDNSTNHSSVTASLDSKLPLQESMAAENDSVVGKKDEETKKSDAVVESIDNSTNHSSVTASLDSELPLQESMAAENDSVVVKNDEEMKKQHIDAEVESVDNPNSSITDCLDSKLSLQELLAADKDTIVGLDYITELQMPDGESKIHCSICGVCTDIKNIKIHLFSTKHPINYLNAVNPSIINRIAAKGLKKRKRTIEILGACQRLYKQRGPGTIVVEQFDPSAPQNEEEKAEEKKQSVDAGIELTNNPTKNSSTAVSSPSKLPNRSLQEFLATANTVIVGLDYITEKQIPFQEPTYRCHLCNVFCCFDNIKDHVTGFRHRTNYLHVVNPEINAKIIAENAKPSLRSKEVVKACRKICKKRGSGTITVEYCDPSTSKKEKKQVPESSSQKKNCMLYELRHRFYPKKKATSKNKFNRPTVREYFNRVNNYPDEGRHPGEQTKKRRQFDSDDCYPPLSPSRNAKRWRSHNNEFWNRNEISSSECLPDALVPNKEEFVMNVISSVTKRILKDKLQNIAGLAKAVVKKSLKSGCIQQLLSNFPRENNVREMNRVSNATSVGFSRAKRMTDYPQRDWNDSRNISRIRDMTEPEQAWNNTEDMMDKWNCGNSRHIPHSRDVMMDRPFQDRNDRCDAYTHDMRSQRDWNNIRIDSSSRNIMDKPQYDNNTGPIGDTMQRNWSNSRDTALYRNMMDQPQQDWNNTKGIASTRTAAGLRNDSFSQYEPNWNECRQSIEKNRSANIDSYNQRENSLLMRNTNISSFNNPGENWNESSHTAGIQTHIAKDQNIWTKDRDFLRSESSGPFNQFAASNIHQRTNSSTSYNQRNIEFSQIQSNVDHLSYDNRFSDTSQEQSHFINRTGIHYEGPSAGSKFNSTNYCG